MKSISSLKIALTLSVIFWSAINLQAQTAIQPSGSGTSTDPYLIASLENLTWVSQNSSSWSKYFSQTADIDASATGEGGDWGTAGWQPIGNSMIYFRGTYNGNFYTISNLYVYRPATSGVGLIGYSTGTIKNVIMENVDITGYQYTGGLTGTSGCIMNSSVSGRVTANGTQCGGIAGFPMGNVYRCFSTAAITGTYFVGGIIGNTDSDVYDCFATGPVSGTSDVGGLIGYLDKSDPDVYRCYSIGSVSGSGGGLIGGVDGNGDAYYSYWNTETSGKTSSAGGTAKTTPEMKTQTTYSTWDFSTTSGIWAMDSEGSINDGYPYLTWQITPATQASAISFSDIEDLQMTVTWTNGDATRRVAFIKEGASGSATPVMANSYTAQSVYGSGTQIGSTGWYCIYNGTDNSVTVTGLTVATDYIVQVFEYNGSDGAQRYLRSTSTDNPKSTTTSASGIAYLTTNAISDITCSSAQSGGAFTYAGGSAITAKGVCWSTASNPTVADNYTNDGTGSTAFTSALTGLDDETTYHVRAYATNSYGTSYGDDVTLRTLGSSPGTALNFDGTDDYVSIADNDSLDLTTDYTIEAWIKPETFGKSEGIVSKYQTSSNKGYVLRTGNSGNYRGLCIDELQTADNLLTAGTWYHVAAVNDNGTRHLYLDGVEQTLSGTAMTVANSSNPLCIGRDFSSRYFDGSIDEVRIWKVVRTIQEIRENMYKALDSSGDDLVVYWQFNDNSGATLSATSGAYNGTLTNMDTASVWVSSTIPFGSGSTDCNTSFISGTTQIGNVQVTTTDDFDNSVSLYVTEVDRTPNVMPDGISFAGDRYFVIKCYGTPGTFAVNLKFTFGAGVLSSQGDTAPSGLILYHRDSSSEGEWTSVAVGSEVSSAAGTVVFNNISSFSQFAVAEDYDASLPVSLTEFSAEPFGNTVKLTWRTESETENLGFIIGRRNTETGEWEEIASYLSC